MLTDSRNSITSQTVCSAFLMVSLMVLLSILIPFLFVVYGLIRMHRIVHSWQSTNPRRECGAGLICRSMLICTACCCNI
jgi:hypothetical protein